MISGVGFSEEANPLYRPSMEDAHALIENFGGKPDQGFFAIYDGHDGRETADYLAGNLHEILLRRVQDGQDLKAALRETYLEVDNKIKWVNIKGGSTAVTALIQQDKLFVANAGDARAVLAKGDRAIRLSYDHKASDPKEKARVETAGGLVLGGYVNGRLAISRSLGDWGFEGLKEVVTPLPYLSETSLTPEDKFLILACDGIWDVISDQEAVDLIKNEPDPQKASEILKNEALKRGSTDNISVIVVKLF